MGTRCAQQQQQQASATRHHFLACTGVGPAPWQPLSLRRKLSSGVTPGQRPGVEASSLRLLMLRVIAGRRWEAMAAD